MARTHDENAADMAYEADQSSKLRTFTVTVTQIVPDDKLTKPDDRIDNPTGSYEFEAADEDDALDQFHDSIPIACLDDFRVDVDIFEACPQCHGDDIDCVYCGGLGTVTSTHAAEWRRQN